MTPSLERVLGAFLADPAAPRYGYDLMKAARLPSGTLYPLLARLEHQKLVASAWETPQQEGQRPRKYYQLTGEGIRIARLELAQASSRRRRAPARAGRRHRRGWDEGEDRRPPGTGGPGMRGEDQRRRPRATG